MLDSTEDRINILDSFPRAKELARKLVAQSPIRPAHPGPRNAGVAEDLGRMLLDFAATLPETC